MNKKVKNYVEDMKEYLEYKKVINLESCENDGINYNDILDELDNQNIKYRKNNYYNEHDQLQYLASRTIYCNQFYITTGGLKMGKLIEISKNKLKNVLQGAELTAAEKETIEWLAGNEPQTVENICSIIEKAKGINE